MTGKSTHRRPNSACIRCIGLVAQHKRSHCFGREQSDGMTQLLQLGRPPMGSTTRLHRHHCWRTPHEVTQDFVASQLDSVDFSRLAIDSVQLKDVLRDIHSNYVKLHFGSSRSSGLTQHPHFGTLMSLQRGSSLPKDAFAWHPVAGGRHPYKCFLSNRLKVARGI